MEQRIKDTWVRFKDPCVSCSKITCVNVLNDKYLHHNYCVPMGNSSHIRIGILVSSYITLIEMIFSCITLWITLRDTQIPGNSSLLRQFGLDNGCLYFAKSFAGI